MGTSVSEYVVCVCVCVVCVCVLFVDLFQDDLRYLFSPHQVNHGGVQKTPAQVSLYKSHTTEGLFVLLPLKISVVQSNRPCDRKNSFKNLSGDAEVAGTARYFGPSRETLADAASTTSEGLCRWAPVGLACTFEAGLPCPWTEDTSKSMDSVLIPKSSSKSLRDLTCSSVSFSSP